uniref:restriction endonuclease subunit S n=1 Tax=Alistipes sp. TaxID=1872444 RepID=UPI0040568429
MTSWKTYKLSDITIMRNGKKRPNTRGIYPVYGGNGIMDYADCYNAENTIIIGRVGAYCGNVYQCKDRCWVSDNAISVSANDLVDNNYLYYLMSSLDFHHHHIGGAQPLMTQDIIGGFEISLPPLAEQRRIAGILGAIDDKIENNRRINTNLELQAQALYKQWFVDNRKDDWETLMLDDVATLSAGGDKPQVCSDKKTPDCKIPIYSNGIDNEGLYGYTNNPRIKENSITISARGTIGFVCLRTEPYVPIVRLISVVPTYENMSAYFLYLWALTQNISGTGTTQQQLTVPAFRTTKIVVPSQNVLIKFNQVVKPIFDNIKQNKNENETLANLRDALLPKLMNGEIKL